MNEEVLIERARKAYKRMFSTILDTGPKYYHFQRREISLKMKFEIKGQVVTILETPVSTENVYGKCRNFDFFEEIMDRLKIIRRKVAKSREMPESAVASDNTLVELCKELPQSWGAVPEEFFEEIRHFKLINAEGLNGEDSRRNRIEIEQFVSKRRR